MRKFELHLIGHKAANAIKLNAAAKATKGVQKPIDWAGFSGRGVRLRVLEDPEEKRKVEDMQARSMGDVSGMLSTSFQAAMRLAGIRRCMLEVTVDREVLDPRDPGVKWQRVTEADLEEPNGRLSFGKLFTVKDAKILEHWYLDHHEATNDDLEAIMGKAIELTDES